MGQFILDNYILLGILSMVGAIVMMLVVRRVIGLQFLRSHHEVSDPLLACVGTLFAILLGFMVANAMTRFEEARLNVEREAGAISDLYRLSRGLPEQSGNAIRNDCLHYLNGVIDIEWNEMRERKMSYQVWKDYGQIWTDCMAIEPQNDKESNIHASMLSSMVNLGDYRRIRATQMSYALPGILWIVVLIGAGATGTLVLFFGIESILIQSFTTALVTLVLFLNVFLLASYDSPFGGSISIKPLAFEVARDSLGRRYKEMIPHTGVGDGAIDPAKDETDGESLEDDASDDADNAETKNQGKADDDRSKKGDD